MLYNAHGGILNQVLSKTQDKLMYHYHPQGFVYFQDQKIKWACFMKYSKNNFDNIALWNIHEDNFLVQSQRTQPYSWTLNIRSWPLYKHLQSQTIFNLRKMEITLACLDIL